MCCEIEVTTIAIVALVLFIQVSRVKKGAAIFLILYVMSVLIITLFVRSFDVESKAHFNPIRKYVYIVQSIENGINRAGISGGWEALKDNEYKITEIILNVLLFVPLGFLVPISSDFFRRAWKTVAIGFAFSFFIESMQLVTHLGCFDVSDLIHNTMGACIGYFIFYRWLKTDSRDVHLDITGGQI